MALLTEALLKACAGKRDVELYLERDDGVVAPVPIERYVGRGDLPELERAALARARGRVCDAGCAAGRHALSLLDRGLEVVAVDIDPGLVELSRRLGVPDVHLADLASAKPPGGPFDCILLLDNGLGMAGRHANLAPFLAGLASTLASGGEILTLSVDLTQSDDPKHRRHGRTEGGRLGEQRLRLVSHERVGPWFDWIQPSPVVLAQAATSAQLACEVLAHSAGGAYLARLAASL
jgi:SAM-dependent methyltransferase